MPGARELLELLAQWIETQLPVESDDDFLRAMRISWPTDSSLAQADDPLA